MTKRSFVWAIAISCIAALVASDALAARKVAATGFWRVDLGIPLPLMFKLQQGMGTGPGMTIFLQFPNSDPAIDGDLSVTGKSPANFTIPTNFVAGTYSALLALMGTTNVQITSMFTIMRPAAASAGTFSAMGGPGSFTFCPGSPPGLPGAACPAPPASPQGTSTRHGRIVYTGGAGFGGTARALLAGSGALSIARPGFGFGSPIFQIGNQPLGGMATFPTGYQGATRMASASPAIYTQPRTAPTTMGVLTSMQGGPIVTSMNALTSCPATSMGGAFPNIPLTGSLACLTGTGPPLGATGQSTTSTGFAFTTGTVLIQATTNPSGTDLGLTTLTGTDTRTPRGVGNIVMVAGKLGTRTALAATRTNRGHNRISITFSEKTPTMTPGGIAAAALLMVLGAGYAMRRRF